MNTTDFELLENVFLAIEYIKEKTVVDKNEIIRYFNNEVIKYLMASKQLLLSKTNKFIYAYAKPKLIDSINKGVDYED